jgi:hypothetical protein
VAVDSLLDRHRRPDRLRGAREGGHDAVAGILHQGAALSRDRFGQQTLVRLPNALGRLLTEDGALRGRVDEVGEENRRRSGRRSDGFPLHREKCLSQVEPSRQGIAKPARAARSPRSMTTGPWAVPNRGTGRRARARSFRDTDIDVELQRLQFSRVMTGLSGIFWDAEPSVATTRNALNHTDFRRFPVFAPVAAKWVQIPSGMPYSTA